MKRWMAVMVLSWALSGCAHALFGSNSIGRYEPFVQHIKQPQTLKVPCSLSYAKESPIIGFWSHKTYREGEMYFLTNRSSREAVFELPVGTVLELDKVVYHTNMAGSCIVAFGEVYVADVKKKLPFIYDFQYSYEEPEHFLNRAPWESLDIPEKRKVKLGLLTNQYLGIEK